MNKIVLTLATLALLGASCKKERNCNCKYQQKVIKPSGTTEVSQSYTMVMKDVSYLTAMKACVHSQVEEKPNDSTTVTIDTHCSLD